MITELGLDCGDICLKEPIEISETLNCMQLFDIVADKSPEIIEKTLIGLAEHAIKPEKQCEDGVCMANKLTKEECKIDWSKSAQDLHNLVRGIYKCPSAYFNFNDKIIKVLETEVLNGTGKEGEFINVTKEGVEVACGKGSLLLKCVKPQDKKEMSARDWYNGVKNVIKGN